MEFSIDFPFFVFERAGLADNEVFNLAILIPKPGNYPSGCSFSGL